MPGNTLIAGLKGKSVVVIYTVPTINRLIESGEPGVTSGNTCRTKTQTAL